jgi:glycosyltransferase involved in cell wall biosynthesis
LARIPPGERDLTVVIPYWDLDPTFLLEALASLAEQAVSVRTIVVDNASAVPLPELPSGVEVVRLAQRVSVGEARNRGLALVETSHVFFLDADEVLPPGAIRALLDPLVHCPGAIVSQGRAVRWHWPEMKYRPLRPAPLNVLVRLLQRCPRAFAAVNTCWMLLSMTSTVLRVDTVRRAGGFSSDVAESDWVLSAVLAFKGPVVFVPRVTRIMRLRPDSLTRRKARDWRISANARREMRRCLRGDPDVPRLVRWTTPLLAVLHARPVLSRTGRRLLRQ